MDKIKIKHINIIVLSIVILFNLITGVLKNKNYEYYIFYIIPFIITLIIIILNTKNYKLDAYMFLIVSILCIIIGNWGNLTGAIFLCFSFYCFENNKKITLLIIGCTIITIALKFIFLMKDVTISEVFNFLIGYAYIILAYCILIHPKKLFLNNINEDKINTKIIDYLVNGYKTKDISEKINITQNAITKRVENMRRKYDCNNNEQLIFYFIKNKKITLI